MIRHFEETEKNFQRSGTLYVTFQSQAHAGKVLEAASTGCWFFKKCRLRVNSRSLHLYQANEPSDIIWENLCYSSGHKFKHRILSFLLSVGILACSFSVILLLKIEQVLEFEDLGKDTTYGNFFRVRSLSLLISLAIIVTNRVIAILIGVFSVKEKYNSFTNQHKAVFIKTLIGLSVNSIAIIMVVNGLDKRNYFKPYGLVNDVLSLLVVDTIVSPLIFLFSPLYIFQLWQRRKMRNRVINDTTLPITQLEANKLWENPQVDLSQWYANGYKTLMLSLVFAPLFPLAPVFGLVCICIQYWLSKALLIRRHSRPIEYGAGMAKLSLSVFSVVILFYLSSNLYFQLVLTPDNIEVPLVFIVLFLAYLLVPMWCLYRTKAMYQLKEHIYGEDELDYESQLVNFFDDYKRSNPVTRIEGWKEWIQVIERILYIGQNGEEEKKKMAVRFAPLMHQNFRGNVMESEAMHNTSAGGLSGNQTFGTQLKLGMVQHLLKRSNLESREHRDEVIDSAFRM